MLQASRLAILSCGRNYAKDKNPSFLLFFMNKLRLSFLVLLGISVAIITSLSIQIITMHENTRILHESNDKLRATLNNYTELFGNIENSDKYPNVFKLTVNTYVAPFEDEFNPTETVKMGHTYSVTAKVDRSNKSLQQLIHYVLLISIKDQNNKTIVTSWSYKQMLPNEFSSYSGIYWTPNSSGNYTIESFAWASLTGTALAEPSQNGIHVTE